MLKRNLSLSFFVAACTSFMLNSTMSPRPMLAGATHCAFLIHAGVASPGSRSATAGDSYRTSRCDPGTTASRPSLGPSSPSEIQHVQYGSGALQQP